MRTAPFDVTFSWQLDQMGCLQCSHFLFILEAYYFKKILVGKCLRPFGWTSPTWPDTEMDFCQKVVSISYLRKIHYCMRNRRSPSVWRGLWKLSAKTVPYIGKNHVLSFSLRPFGDNFCTIAYCSVLWPKGRKHIFLYFSPSSQALNLHSSFQTAQESSGFILCKFENDTSTFSLG